MEHPLTSLTHDAVTMVDYPAMLREEVEQTGELWQQFCALPPEEKELFTATSIPSGAVHGYEDKDGTGPNADRKENFDVTPGYNAAAADNPIAASFTKAAADLAASVADLAVSTARQIEADSEVANLGEIVKVSHASVFVRFLHYFPKTGTGQSLAEPHTDQSGFTFHLYETAPGCERLDPTTRTWQPLPVETRQTALFPAMQLQLLSGSELKALCHRVTTTEETRRKGRFAIVAFIRFAGVPEYDKKTHGRLQEMKPGFNYDMSVKEFAQLFTK